MFNLPNWFTRNQPNNSRIASPVGFTANAQGKMQSPNVTVSKPQSYRQSEVYVAPQASVLGSQSQISGSSSAPAPSRTYDAGALTPDRELANLTAQRDNQESALRDSISNRSNSYKGYLDEMQNLVPQYQQEDTNFINQSFGTALNSLNTARDSGINKLGIARNQVDERKSNALSDLQSQLNNQMRNTGMQLGAMGAGNSSAAEIMAPYAFAKLGNQSRTQVFRDANNQFADIDLKEQDIITTYDTEKNQIERDKIDALSNIRNYYRDRVSQVQEAKSFASDREYEALENLEMGLLEEASGKLNSVRDFVLQRNAELEDWTRNRMTQIQDKVQGINSLANFQVNDINPMAISGMSPAGGTGGQDENLLNLGLLQKRLDDGVQGLSFN